MVTALYPGSFDPATNGHLDIIARGAALFQHLIIAVYDAPPKSLWFTTAERVALVQQAAEHIPNVEIRPFSGLVVEFARQVSAKVIVRGLRVGYDFEYEFEMALMNKTLAPEIEIVCLMSSLEYQFVSSSRIKEVAQLGGNISGLVPEHVAKALQERLRSPV